MTSCDSGCSPFVFKIILNMVMICIVTLLVTIVFIQKWLMALRDNDVKDENDDYTYHYDDSPERVSHPMMAKMTLMTKLMTNTLVSTRYILIERELTLW